MISRRGAIGSVLALGALPSFGFAQANPKWPDATDTGYENAPGYPGRLTPYNGAPLVADREYRFIDFRGATITVPRVNFYGCRFASNWVEGWNVRLANTGVTEFRFCTIEPSRIAAPPNAVWPSAGAGENVYGGAVSAYMIGHTMGYQYGILQVSGGLLVEDSNIWGFGNAIVLFGSARKTIRRCWIHDAAHEGPGAAYHQDGPGHLDGFGCSNVLIEDCVIASLGNTNAIAFQAGTYNNITVRRNFLSGFGYCVDMCHGSAGNTSLTFEDNIIATDLGWYWGPLYTNFSANFQKAGSSWSGNRLRVMKGTRPRVGSNGQFDPTDHYKYVHPNGVYSSTDWTA